jgi:hypothetical protein
MNLDLNISSFVNYLILDLPVLEFRKFYTENIIEKFRENSQVCFSCREAIVPKGNTRRPASHK